MDRSDRSTKHDRRMYTMSKRRVFLKLSGEALAGQAAFGGPGG